MTLRRRMGLLLTGLLVCAGISAWLQIRITLPGFTAVDEMLELDRRSSVPALKRGFSVMPHPQYTFAIFVRNKDDETVMRLKGLPRQRYLVRFKARFPTVNHSISLFLNEVPLGTMVPEESKVAQKFRLIAPPEAIREDENEVRFVHHGVRAAVTYELLELRNYWSANESENVRVYFDGPWIAKALQAARPGSGLRYWGWWILRYAALWFLAWGIGRFGLRLSLTRIVRFIAIGMALAPLIPLVALAVTFFSPMTVWIASSWFVASVVIGPVAVTGLLFAASVIQTVIRTFLRTQTALMAIWARVPYARLLTKLWLIVLVGWMVLRLSIEQGWRVAARAIRWLRRDVVRHAFALFMSLYGAGMACLIAQWRDGAERLVDAAFGALLMAVAAVGWRTMRMAWALRGHHGA